MLIPILPKNQSLFGTQNFEKGPQYEA